MSSKSPKLQPVRKVSIPQAVSTIAMSETTTSPSCNNPPFVSIPQAVSTIAIEGSQPLSRKVINRFQYRKR